MEGNMPARNMMPGPSYGMLDLQGSMHNYQQQQQPQASIHQHQQQQQQPLQPQHGHPHPHHQAPMVRPPMHDMFPLSSGHMHDRPEHPPPHPPALLPMMDYNKVERSKTSASDDDEPSLNTEDGPDGHNDPGKGKKASPWQRMKWTDGMVRLLITAVSYIGEDSASECSAAGRRKLALLQKKGKWKSVSKVLAERGCYVSPQQCEDKFNDLNKRYKRLNDILGRGTSCKVVENPALLDVMDHLSEKAKEDVRKILSSKHLFYEEMCSYHNGNRLHLPADPALQRSLLLALGSGDDHDVRRGTAHDDLDDDNHDMDSDEKEDNTEENIALHGDFGGPYSLKRTRSGVDHDDMGFGNQDASRRPHPHGIPVDMNQEFPEGSNALAQKQWLSFRLLQLEEQRLRFQGELLELEKQRFKWQRFSKKKDRELEKMKLDIERSKLENERVQLELRHKELDIDRRIS